jgi:spore maturation protein CgeB
MRIFYASDNTPNSIIVSNLWRDNLYSSLVDLGHDVVEFQYDLRETFQNLNPEDPGRREFIDQNRPKISEELLRQIKLAHAAKPVELFFSYFYDACVLPEAIDEIRALGITTVNWYCNGSYQLHLVAEISPHYDWCLVPEKFRLKDYVAMGARPIYCQEAANPNIYKPYNLPVEFDVTFVGQAYGDRPAHLKYLRDRGIDVRLWGWGWRESYTEQPKPIVTAAKPAPIRRALYIGRRLMTVQGWQAALARLTRTTNAETTEMSTLSEPGPITFPARILGSVLSDLEMIQMYSRSRINLGFSSCGETHETDKRILQVRLRDFEVPMSGGFYMVEYMEELEEFYEIGKEIVCYTDAHDLADKIKYYLRHDRERERIRKAGYERCLRDHTWQKRFAAAFREMGLN